MGKKILVVDDEKKITEIIKAYLERDNFSVIVAYDGKEALESVKYYSPDLVILDLMLPEISGWEVCRILRKGSNIPIIMLTARDETTDKIVGLELGADDYIVKPFDVKELVSRVKAVLRRFEGVSAAVTNMIQIAELVIDIEKRKISRSGMIIELTPIEFDLLQLLAKHPGRVFSRLQLLDSIRGDDYDGYERTIDSHIKNLRKKIEPEPEKPIYIITVYGVGYKLEKPK